MFAAAAGIGAALALLACGGDDFNQTRPDASTVDAIVGDPCEDVTGACLTNQGSTMMEDVRIGEDGIANMMTDVLLSEASVVAEESIDIAFINGGAIRGGVTLGPPDYEWSSETARIGNTYGPGPITREDILGWFPFPNDNVVMTLTGAQLKRSLERGVDTFADDAGTTFGADLIADTGGPFLHAAGLSYEATCPGTTRIVIGPTDCDPFAGECEYLNADEADTITKITVGTTVIYDASNGGWQGDGETHGFRVVTNSFVAAGLDNHLDFPDGTSRHDITIDEWNYAEALADYLEEHTPTTLDRDQGRIVVVGTVGGIPCNLPASCTPAHAATHPSCQHL